ncbi:unnamed protein product, partial [marine sediment metagenome]
FWVTSAQFSSEFPGVPLFGPEAEGYASVLY